MCNNSIEDEKEVFAKIYENYKYLSEMIVDVMEISSIHGGITGDYREQTWIKLFRSIIPKKFSLAQGVMIIDSYGHVSKEVDIAVYDEQYTPYVFQYDNLKFIPIEAVAVVIECKSKSLKPEPLKDWVKAIQTLEPRCCGIARMVNGYFSGFTNKSQTKTRPIRILANICTEKDSTSIDHYYDYFDFIIKEESESNNKKNVFKLLVPKEENSLAWWGKELNCIKETKEFDKSVEGNKPLKLFYIKEKDKEKEEEKKEEYKKLCEKVCEDCSKKCFDNNLNFDKKLKDLHITHNPLLSLNFQLNQLLMLINNPMLFPHYAYANYFNNIIKDLPEEDKNSNQD